MSPKYSPLKTWCLLPAPSEKLTHVKDGLDGRGKLTNLQELVRALASQVPQECRVSLCPPLKNMFLPLFYRTYIALMCLHSPLGQPGPIRGSHRSEIKLEIITPGTFLSVVDSWRTEMDHWWWLHSSGD